MLTRKSIYTEVDAGFLFVLLPCQYIDFNVCMCVFCQVQHDVDGEGKWTECFDVVGVELPTGYFLGLSAATGDLAGIFTSNFSIV